MTCRRLAVFASGSGSNFQSIVEARQRGELDLEPVALVSNRNAAGVLERARREGIESAVFGRSCWGREAPDAQRVLDWLEQRQVDCIALAGFLKMVPPVLVAAYRGRMLNIHPALLPAFGGAGMYGGRVHRAVWEAGCRLSGPTVHLVDEAFDRGPIVAQEAVLLEPEDGPDEIAAKVLAVEHRIYPRALNMLASRGFIIKEGRAIPCPDCP